MHEILDPAQSLRMFAEAVKRSQASAFRAECKMAFPTIDDILVRASSVMTEQLTSNGPFLHFFLVEMKKAYRSGNDLWFERKITMPVFYEVLLKEIKRHAFQAMSYEIALDSGESWAFTRHGPLINWKSRIYQVQEPDPSYLLCAVEREAFSRFLLRENDLRMLATPVQSQLKGCGV